MAWIASLDPFLRQRPGIAGFVWCTTTPESMGATGDYRIDDTAEHLDAFRGLLRSQQARCAGSSPAAIAGDRRADALSRCPRAGAATRRG